MALKKLRPTSPGTRFQLRPDRSHLHKGGPVRALVVGHKSTGGRNNSGRLPTRPKGSGHKHSYRMIDFRRDKDGVVAKVEHLEYDPNRSAYIALLLYKDGERRYILAPRGGNQFKGSAIYDYQDVKWNSDNTKGGAAPGGLPTAARWESPRRRCRSRSAR